MASLGELERSVMEMLWTNDAALTANELRDTLAVRDGSGRTVATTTMLTVLSRLERKGFVSRTRDVRPHRYRALLSREEHTAELMHEVLDQSTDRAAALARFVGTVSEGEANTLRRLLDELTHH
ncbi:BlaI/MecI/CopY family transcriptional regulator [Agromyces bauzanensis]